MGRRRRIAFVAATCVAAGGVLTAAHAITPVSTDARRAAATSSLHLPPPPYPNTFPLGITVDPAVQSVKKAKVTFSVVPFRALLYLRQVVTHIPYANGLAQIFVTDPTGPADNFGDFAPVKVQTLAFGSIPVTATVHISQVQHGKFPIPFKVKQVYTIQAVKPPHRLPCSPNDCYYAGPADVRGQVEIRIDHVEIDQVPVDVGPNCHTASPALVHLTSKAGYYANTIPPYSQPGVFQVGVGGTLSGPVDVPAFTGCRNGSDDLSPILTSTVSGPGNILTAHQDGPFVNYPPPRPKRK